MDLARTGEHETYAEAEYSAVTMPGGWIVIVNCLAFGDFILSKPLDRVKSGAEVLTCYQHEGTMMSHLAAFHGGGEIWSVTHDCKKGLDDLGLSGRRLSLLPRSATTCWRCNVRQVTIATIFSIFRNNSARQSPDFVPTRISKV